MRKSLREISHEAFQLRVVLFGKQPDIVTDCKQLVEQLLCVVNPALQNVVIHQPETAREENSFLSWQSIDGGGRVVPLNEAIAQETFLDRAYRAENARVVVPQKTHKWDLQQRRVQ